MRIAIKMLGLTTTFFWIFLIAFLVTAFYSVRDVSFDFGEPQIGMDTDNQMVFSLLGTITNRGFYDIGDFTVATDLRDQNGFPIAHGRTVVPVVRRNVPTTINHQMAVNISDLLETGPDYLFNDTELKVYAMVGMSLARMIPAQVSTNFTFPWGAPLYDFSLGQPQYAMLNMTHSRVTVPITFENHALFDLTGSLRVRIRNSADLVVGEGQSTLNAPQNSFYNGHVEILIRFADVTTSGNFDVYFETSVFSYGPWVIPYG